MIFKLDISPVIVQQAKEYLKPFTGHEEGGLFLGTRTIIKEPFSVQVKITELAIVKTKFAQYQFDQQYRRQNILPDDDIGYYPDPEKFMEVLSRTKSEDDTSDLQLTGFLHNHCNGEANPSAYDLTHVDRTPGYVMAIYSNRRDHIKFWYVLQTIGEKWKRSGQSLSLAAVELAAIL